MNEQQRQREQREREQQREAWRILVQMKADETKAICERIFIRAKHLRENA